MVHIYVASVVHIHDLRLVAGYAHVDAELGVPQHLPPGLRVEAITWPKAPPARDYCADLRRQMQRPAQP